MVNARVHPGSLLKKIRKKTQLKTRSTLLHSATALRQGGLRRHTHHYLLLHRINLIRYGAQEDGLLLSAPLTKLHECRCRQPTDRLHRFFSFRMINWIQFLSRHRVDCPVLSSSPGPPVRSNE